MDCTKVERLRDLYVGKRIRIVSCADPYVGKDYNGREGVVNRVDDIGQLHGTWGGVALVLEEDEVRFV